MLNKQELIKTNKISEYYRICVILGFHRDVGEICVLLGCYAS